MRPNGTRAPLIARVGFALTRIYSEILPISWIHFMGYWFAPVLFRCWPRVRRALLENAVHILGEESTYSQRKSFSVNVLRNFSRFTIEVMTSHRKLPANHDMLWGAKGRHHYERARDRGKGIIACTLHMGNYEVGSMLLTAAHNPVAVVYNRDPSKHFEISRSRRRRGFGLLEIPVDRSPLFGVKVLKVLRAGGMVLLAADLGFEEADGDARFPLFGQPAPFLCWPARLAMVSGAPILPCFIVLEADGRYRLEIAEPIFPEDLGTADAIMRTLIPVLEDVIRRYPDQWLVIHDYWNGQSRT